ncbi:hypothetical protein AX16_003204 [Volvariella volvacea WC 439]|nr:hypothetical protein AX16_003204 [Volvariella volvacea WC 439]
MVNLLSALVLSLLAVVGAVPAWEAGRSTISSLVPGAGYLEALAAARGTEGITRHVTVTDLSSPGNVTVMVHTKRPATFFVNHNQLWQFYNETAIYRVNLINATHIENHPLQLVTSKKAEGVTGGVWRWSGTMLYYDHGRRGNQGLYYHCDSDTMKGSSYTTWLQVYDLPQLVKGLDQQPKS